MKKTAQFKRLLQSDQLELICEAHNGLSAKIVEETGFKGIWGSGLSLSAQYGVRDSNEASWTQVLEMLEFMADATTIPILLDGDTGYGNFNNMRRLVRKLEQRDVAAVCIEDKLFPKTNSFIRGTAQPLADMDEFAGKIKAGKDAQGDDDFCIVARVEAFIAGWGLPEALKRAEAYHAAGADAILMHSALSVPDEVLAFKREWDDRCPVVIVPTKYHTTPTDVFREHRFSIAIFANQILRSSITGMQDAAKRLFEAEDLTATEDRIVAVSEIFRLQGADELAAAEKTYLPRRGDATRAVVLAAARGTELGELTAARPKAMVMVGDAPMLSHIIQSYNAVGIKNITVVRGYQKDAVDLAGVSYADNDDYETTGELYSFHKALDTLASEAKDTIVSYGDVLFRKYIVEMVADCPDDLVIVADTAWEESVNRDRHADNVSCTLPFSREVFGRAVYLEKIAHEISDGETHAEWMGFLKISAGMWDVVRRKTEEILGGPEGAYAKLPDLIAGLREDGHKVRVLYTTGSWLDIDVPADLALTGRFQ